MQDGPYVCQQNMKQIFEYTSKLEGRCENLEPDTSYQMRFILSIAESDITGDWETVETDCFCKLCFCFLSLCYFIIN